MAGGNGQTKAFIRQSTRHFRLLTLLPMMRTWASHNLFRFQLKTSIKSLSHWNHEMSIFNRILTQDFPVCWLRRRCAYFLVQHSVYVQVWGAGSIITVREREGVRRRQLWDKSEEEGSRERETHRLSLRAQRAELRSAPIVYVYVIPVPEVL